MAQPVASDLSCSFCRKPENAVAKLISSPSDNARAYICDECVAVCSAVIEDERLRADDRPENGQVFEEQHPLLSHRLPSRLISTVERWIRQESLGGDAAESLAEVRAIATQMLADTSSAEA
jgi:hypothetical protein